jgi:hypothetical protein
MHFVAHKNYGKRAAEDNAASSNHDNPSTATTALLSRHRFLDHRRIKVMPHVDRASLRRALRALIDPERSDRSPVSFRSRTLEQILNTPPVGLGQTEPLRLSCGLRKR